MLTLLIELGNHVLLPDQTDQVIDVRVIETTSNESNVSGFNLRAQIGDGTGSQSEPTFNDIEFAGIWEQAAHTEVGGPLTLPQFAQAGVLFNEPILVPASGLVARLHISTEGIAAGTFDLRLGDTEIGQDSAFVGLAGQTIPIEAVSGTITVTSNPWHNAAEPVDTTNDGIISARDVLLIINELNLLQPPELPPLTETFAPPAFLDVSNDGLLTARDALIVINWINDELAQNNAEGESPQLRLFGFAQDPAPQSEQQTNDGLEELATTPVSRLQESHSMVSLGHGKSSSLEPFGSGGDLSKAESHDAAFVDDSPLFPYLD